MKKLIVSLLVACAAAVSFGEDYLFRWTVDGGANWTYSTSGRLSEIAEGATALAEAAASNDAPAFETTVESAVVEILAPGCTLDKNIYFDKSFTLRSGEGGPFTVTRTGNYRFESSGTGEPTLMMTNVVLDGGVTWKYATIDTNLTAAANCELADGSKTHKGTILELYRKATLILEDGATVRNVQTYSAYSQEGIGGIVIGHHWDSASGLIEIRHGATLRDIRGPVHVVRCIPTTEGSGFRMTGGLITGCVNSNTDLGEYGNGGGLVFLKTPLKSMSGGTVSGNYVYSRGMFFVDNAYTTDSAFAMSGDATVTNNFAEVAAAGVSPWFSNRVSFSGSVVVKDNFLADGSPANVVPISGLSGGIYLRGSLDHAASIHVTCDGTKAAGSTFGNAESFTGSALQPANFVNDLNPGYVGNKSASNNNLVWIKGEDPEPDKKYGLRYSTDGGATWTEQELLVLPDCGGILTKTYNGGTVDSNIIEIFSDVTLNESRTFVNSFTIRNAEGYSGKIIRSGQCRFDASEGSDDYGQTMYVTNLVIDGGITWKHPTLDIANGVAENAAIAAQTGTENFGTLIRFSKYGKLILDAGAVIQNAQTKYVYYNTAGYGTIACMHHWDTCKSHFEMRPGAVIRDCRGTGPALMVNSTADDPVLTMSGGLVTGCMNLLSNAETGSGVICKREGAGSITGGVISNNIACVGGAINFDRGGSKDFTISGGRITGNYATEDGGALFFYNKWFGVRCCFAGKPYVYGNWLIDPTTGAKIPCDVCSPGSPWNTGAAMKGIFVTGNLEEGAKVGIYQSRPVNVIEGFTEGVDLSNAADVFVNEVNPDYVAALSADGKSLVWAKGPNADKAEDVAEVSWEGGSETYKNVSDAIAAAHTKKTATVKFLADAIVPSTTFAEGEHIVYTSDDPVTLTTYSCTTWPSSLTGSSLGSASFELAGQVALKHAVYAPANATALVAPQNMSGSYYKGDVILSGDAIWAGSVNLSVADFRLRIGEGASEVTGKVTVGDASRLVLEGSFGGTVNVAGAVDGATFGTVDADFTTATADDAFGFRAADNPGLCGMLSNGTLVWMRCAVTIKDDGTVDTYDYAGDLTLGSTYEFTVNASADYLNSKVGRKGVYPLIRANSVTGKPNLILPAGLDYRWYAREVYDGDTLIGYDLVSNGPGLLLLLR